eukprot:459997_1
MHGRLITSLPTIASPKQIMVSTQQHAIQHIIHSEINDIKELLCDGLLDDIQYNKMIKTLINTNNCIKHIRFYYTLNENYNDENKNEFIQKQTLKDLPFIEKLNKNTYEKK